MFAVVVEIPLSGELSCSLFTAGTREVSLEEYTCRVINRYDAKVVQLLTALHRKRSEVSYDEDAV